MNSDQNQTTGEAIIQAANSRDAVESVNGTIRGVKNIAPRIGLSEQRTRALAAESKSLNFLQPGPHGAKWQAEAQSLDNYRDKILPEIRKAANVIRTKKAAAAGGIERDEQSGRFVAKVSSGTTLK